MRRVLAYCWGVDASQWVGRRVRLFCDPAVRFGSELVGGTRIEALSHIDKPKTVPLLVSRGRSATYHVEPLTEEPARDWRAEADALTDRDELLALYHQAPAEHRDYIKERGQALTSGAEA